MKIHLTNSPFDFDQVGRKTADRWFRQGKADYSTDRTSLTFRDSFTLRMQLQAREDERFNAAVDESCSAKHWKTVHSGSPRMPGGPKLGVKQFVA